MTQEGSSIGGISYTYDDENRLSQVVTNVNDNGSGGDSLQGAVDASPDSVTTHPWKCEFVYDGLGRLRQRLEYLEDTLQSTTRYIYDGMRVIQERNSANTPAVAYTRGADLSGSLEGAGGIGGLLARSSGYSGGNWTSHAYYHADGNGNITCLINGSQSVVASYRYDPFGNTTSKSGSLADANVYRFSSKEIVSHTNSVLYYYGYRFYDPPFHRWLNRDPIQEWGGANLYAFVLNTPTSVTDDFGLEERPQPYPGGTCPIGLSGYCDPPSRPVRPLPPESDPPAPMPPFPPPAAPAWPWPPYPATWPQPPFPPKWPPEVRLPSPPFPADSTITIKPIFENPQPWEPWQPRPFGCLVIVDIYF
jgi:RHS repeat-associated protein